MKIHPNRNARTWVIRRHRLPLKSLIDELAYKIKMDPVEFRKKNLRDQVYHRQLDASLRRSDGREEIRSQAAMLVH